MTTKKSKIDFKDYEPADVLDEEEAALFSQLQSGEYTSVLTNDLKKQYMEIFSENAKRAKEEGIPYHVLLSSIIHKWLHGRLVER